NRRHRHRATSVSGEYPFCRLIGRTIARRGGSGGSTEHSKHIRCMTNYNEVKETRMSTRRIRSVSAVAATAALALSVAACGGNGQGSEGGENTVRMLVNITDNLTQRKREELVAPFEEKTGIDVKIEGPSGQSVAETFPSLLAAGTAPDVIQSVFPTQDTAPEILDLSEYEWAHGTPMSDL